METNPYPDSKYKNSLEVGLEFQDFVMDVLGRRNFPLQIYSSKRWQHNKGESPQRWEVKLDNRCVETGQLSIEIAEKTRVGQVSWIPSGIYRSDSWFYVQGNYAQFYIFITTTLRWIHSLKKFKMHEKPTIQTFYLPLAMARVIGIEIVPNQADYATAYPAKNGNKR